MRKPNIVYVLADDLGYGDVSCLNPAGKIPTPHLDRLANEGMVFTDAHSSSAVCTPSRYSILTGRYSWRSRLQKGIIGLYDRPLIDAGRLTVGELLRRQGYHTACLGKWHLGMDWPFEATPADFYPGGFRNVPRSQSPQPPDLLATAEQKARWREAFSRPIAQGPLTRGFDYFFGVDAPNWPPYCFLENDRTVGIPSEFLPGRLIGDNLASYFGPAMPYWHFEQLLPMWAHKADEYIERRAAAGEPFFLYMALTSPHTPLSVNKPWIGKSGLNNLYADLVMETDDVFGRVLHALDRHGVADNTLVIFASDNGCSEFVDSHDMEARGHYPSGGFRGYKGDAWDGGHRIPCLARWPGVIKPGRRCDQLVCLSDLMATCADLLDTALPETAGEDSFSMMPLLSGDHSPTRDHVVHHSTEGKFAIRDRRWKLVLCPGSGGPTYSDVQAAAEGLPPVQLYDLENDPGERRNLQHAQRGIVEQMLRRLTGLVHEGRSTPGRRLSNDVEVDLWKRNPQSGDETAMLDDYRRFTL